MKNKEYKIVTMTDLISAASEAESMDDLFIDLRAFVELGVLIRTICDVTGEPAPEGEFEWVDDGKHNMTAKIEAEIKTENEDGINH